MTDVRIAAEMVGEQSQQYFEPIFSTLASSDSLSSQ
jgi:hypothetical protein